MSWQLIVTADAAFMGAYALAVWALLARRRRPEPALHDELTQLPNRTLFRDRLEQALAGSVRARGSCAVVALDVDRFELVNESFGPTAADALLRAVAERLDACLRPEDTAARTGGDEFMVLIATVGSTEDALAVADRIVEALAPPFRAGDSELYLTASAGIALGVGGRDRPEDVLKNADAALHLAKRGAGGREVFRPETSPHPIARLGLETDLRRAIEREELEMVYQPKVELSGGRIVGVEALTRWRHPGRGLLEPADFVPVAEDTGLILPLGRRALERACQAAAGWKAVQVCVNVSGRQLQQPDMALVGEVSAALDVAGLAPSALCLEITESAVMRDVDRALLTLRELKRLGVSIALDDFGKGYSSLSYLRRFPLDVVKIDREFVHELDHADGQAIVRALIDVSHALRATVLGEGIETTAQAATLRRMGCELGQGFCFSPALAPEGVERLLAEGGSLMPAELPT